MAQAMAELLQRDRGRHGADHHLGELLAHRRGALLAYELLFVHADGAQQLVEAGRVELAGGVLQVRIAEQDVAHGLVGDR